MSASVTSITVGSSEGVPLPAHGRVGRRPPRARAGRGQAARSRSCPPVVFKRRRREHVEPGGLLRAPPPRRASPSRSPASPSAPASNTSDLAVDADGVCGQRPDGRFGFTSLWLRLELETRRGPGGGAPPGGARRRSLSRGSVSGRPDRDDDRGQRRLTMPSFAILGEEQEALAEPDRRPRRRAGTARLRSRERHAAGARAQPRRRRAAAALPPHARAARSPRPSGASPTPPADALRETYPMLVRALANISLCYVPGHGVLFTTMERGCYLVPEGPELAETVVARLEPLATAHLVIDNEFRRDLEPELWHGDELTREIGEAGRRLDAPRPAAGALPGRGARERARPAADQAAVRDRRPVVRQPLGPQGRRTASG